MGDNSELSEVIPPVVASETALCLISSYAVALLQQLARKSAHYGGKEKQVSRYKCWKEVTNSNYNVPNPAGQSPLKKKLLERTHLYWENQLLVDYMYKFEPGVLQLHLPVIAIDWDRR